MRAKHLILVITLCTGIMINNLYAGFGIKSGIEFAGFRLSETLSDSESVSATNRHYIRIGLFHDIEISSSISIQTETYFVEKGGNILYKTGAEQFKSKWKLSYIELPLLLKYRNSSKPSHAYVLCGLYTAFMLSNNSNEQNQIYEKDIDCEDQVDTEDKFRRFDLGLIAAIGVNFKLKPVNLLIEARYNHGLLNVHENVDTKNQSFSFLLGASF